MSVCLAPLITCEHAGNDVPPVYAALFRGREALLASHRGFDPGALATAEQLAAAVGAPLFATSVTRLLVDTNRSQGHPALFSEITRPLLLPTREEILGTAYTPHREAVAAAVTRLLQGSDLVLHVASHSFTPVLDGVKRHCDIGLLYDPARPAEKRFCLAWRNALRQTAPDLVLRRNYPYKGAADGLTTAFRQRFGERYCGIELEVNQRFVLTDAAAFARVRTLLATTLARVLADATVLPLA